MIIYFVTSYSWSMNTLFFNPSEFFSSVIESQIKTSNQQKMWEEKQNIESPKKVIIKTITNDNPQSQEIQEEIQESISSDTWFDIPDVVTNEKNESVDTDPLLDSNDYEEIVFSDVFDSEYRNED
jgi:hypothetical protein